VAFSRCGQKRGSGDDNVQYRGGFFAERPKGGEGDDSVQYRGGFFANVQYRYRHRGRFFEEMPWVPKELPRQPRVPVRWRIVSFEAESWVSLSFAVFFYGALHETRCRCSHGMAGFKPVRCRY